MKMMREKWSQSSLGLWVQILAVSQSRLPIFSAPPSLFMMCVAGRGPLLSVDVQPRRVSFPKLRGTFFLQGVCLLTVWSAPS